MLMDQPGSSIARNSSTSFELHGGGLEQARRLFPDAPLPFIDLSTGVNPHSYPLPRLLGEAWQRLPEPESVSRLEVAAAKAYGVRDASMVVAAPGSEILISLLPRLLPQSAVAILGPTFCEYARAFAAAGTVPREIGSLAEAAAGEAVVACNPNNPDGRRLEAGELLAFLDGRRVSGLMLLDEAFADLEPSLSLAPHLPRPGLVILRSFSKSFGLAGVRLGFALAEEGIAVRIRAALGPWQVSGPAIEIGERALADPEWLEATKLRCQSDMQRLDAPLQDAGMQIVGGTLLFRLVRTPHAPELFARLGRAGILIRRFAELPDHLRFGLPRDEAEWQRLARALA